MQAEPQSTSSEAITPGSTAPISGPSDPESTVAENTSETPQRPPIAGAACSVILINQNSGTDLEGLVGAWIEYLESLKRSYDLILVDDGSTDGSAEIAEVLAEQYEHCHLLRHGVPLGVGAALRTGLSHAYHPLVMYTLARREYQPADHKRMLSTMDEVDVMCGQRVWKPIPWWLAAWDFFFRLNSRIWLGCGFEKRTVWLGWRGLGRRLLARWLFGVRLADPECPFCLFRRDVFRHIPVQSDSTFAFVEVIAKANFLGCFMMETPIAHIPSKHPLVEGNFFGDALRVFRHPDFGPVTPASPPPEPAMPIPETAAPNL